MMKAVSTSQVKGLNGMYIILVRFLKLEISYSCTV